MSEQQTDPARTALRDHLISTGREPNDANDLADGLNLASYTSAEGTVDTTGLHNLATRLNITGSRTGPRDFGGGHRVNPPPRRGQDGRAEAQRRTEARAPQTQTTTTTTADQAQTGRGAAGRAEAQRRWPRPAQTT